MGDTDRNDVLRVARAVLAADYACSEDAFLDDKTVITLAQERGGRRRFRRGERVLEIVTMGKGVVVTCDSERISWAQANLGHLDRRAVFSTRIMSQLARYVEADGQVLFDPNLNFLCSDRNLRPSSPPNDVKILFLRDKEVKQLYEHPGFSNALSYDSDAARPDVLAVVAELSGEVMGIAGASADSDTMWQIGVDVIASARGRGIGRAIVSRLTQEVLNTGHVPWYSTAISNVRSHALAVGIGYWPAWVELFTRNVATIAGGHNTK